VSGMIGHHHLARFSTIFSTIYPSISSIHAQPTYGIAVSGGVDSMALALLCSTLKEKAQETQQAPDGGLGHVPRYRAFIVDHRARKGSDEEAKTVRRRLRRLGKAIW